MPLRAVLFDFDGVLVNSEPLHHASLRQALRPEGIDIDEEEYARTYLAYDDWEAVRMALERHRLPYDAERVEALAARKARLFAGMLPSVPFFPGAGDLVRQLSANLPLAIASGARRAEIEAILRGADLRGAFLAIVGADDCSLTKPDPEPYLTAMAQLSARVPDLTAAQCLVFEDSVAGIASGLAAGMRVVGVAHSYAPEKLSAAHWVVTSLAGLKRADLDALFTE